LLCVTETTATTDRDQSIELRSTLTDRPNHTKDIPTGQPDGPTKGTDQTTGSSELNHENASTTQTLQEDPELAAKQPDRGTGKRNESSKLPLETTSSSNAHQEHVASGSNGKTRTVWAASYLSNSDAMTIGLAVSLAVGVSLFVAVVVLVGKRHYDSWRLNDYSAVRHLIDGMNN